MAKNLSIEDNLVPIGKAAEILNVSIDTLRRWDKKGIINSQRVNGKDRCYSIEEIERVRLSKPLTISQAAQLLKVSQSTLRRLDKKGLIRVEKTKSGERLYSKKALENFLHSEYFINKKEVEEKILEPLEKKEEEIPSKILDRGETTHKVIGAMVHNTNEEVSRLKSSRNITFLSVIFVAFSFVLIVILITLLFLLYPKNTASFFGLATVPSGKEIIAISKSKKAVLGEMTRQPENQVGGSVLSSVFKPFAGISLEVVKQISPTTYEEVIPSRIVKDTSNHAIFSLNQQEYIVPQYPIKLPGGYLKVEDKSVITNLNAQYVQGRVPGENKGDLVVFGENGLVPSLSVSSTNLLPGSVVGGVGGVILDGSITGSDLANGTIVDNKLVQITSSNKVAGSAIQLATGGGIVNNSGLSLLTSCSSNQNLIWNGNAWVCSSSGTSGISSLNSLTGVLTIVGAGINSVGASGSTITITGTEADTLATVTGRGATTTTALTLGDVTLSSNKALVVGSYSSDPGLPTSGTIFYNSTTNKLKIVESGTIKILCNATDAGCGAGGTGSNWDVVNGVITPKLTSTLDFLLGSQASASAKFAVLNINSGTPTASISANSGNNAAFLTGAGNLGTTNAQTLTLGGATTGDITLSGRNAANNGIIFSGYGTGLIHSSTTGRLTSSAVDLTSADVNGILTVDKGGTGINGSSAANGSLLIGNGTGFTNAVLTAGSNIAITNAAGSITIAASGLSSFWSQSAGALYPNNSTVDLLVGGQSSSAAKFAVLNINSGTPTASISANSGNNAAFLTGAGNLGTTNAQTLTLGGATTGDIVLAPGGTTALTGRGANLIAAGTLTGLTGLTLASGGITLGGSTGSGKCLLGGATASWGSCAAGTGSNWDVVNGVITPKLTSTLDFLLGSQASASAKFAVLNINSGTPTASISANSGNNAAFLTGAGNLGTTNAQTLTLGGATTGDILLSPLNGAAGSTFTSNAITNAFSGSSAALSFTGGGTNIISSTGTLQINAFTLGGTVTGNSQTISGIGTASFGTNNLSLSGTTISTLGNNSNLTLAPNGTGTTLLTSNYQQGVQIASSVSSSPLAPLYINGGIGNNAALIVNNTNSGALFTASASGVTQFTISNGGNLTSVAGAQWLPLTDSKTALQIANAAGTRFVTFDTTDSRVGIGTTVTPRAALDVNGSVVVQTNIGVGTNAFGSGSTVLSIANTGGAPNAVANTGILYVSSGALQYRGPTTLTQLAAADYAEAMPSVEEINPAEIVSVSSTPKTNADIYNNFLVQRSNVQYDPKIIGIASSFASNSASTTPMIALAGRVPVKVTTENGPINVGDPITSSSIPGVGMKAVKSGAIVGKALQSYDNSDPNAIGQTLVFVNVSWYEPSVYIGLDGSLAYPVSSEAAALALGLTGVPAQSQIITKDLTVDSIKPAYRDISLNLTSDGQLIVKDENGQKNVIIDGSGNAFFAGTLTADKIRANQIEGLEILTNKISSISSSVATLSANFDNFFSSSSSSVLGDKISPSPSILNLSSLKVDGLATVSGNLRVKGDSLIEGILNVVDTITTQNVILTNIANFLGDTVFKGNVSFFGHPTFNKDTGGTVVIKTGSNSVEVKFDSEYEIVPIVNATLTVDQNSPSGTIGDVEQRLLRSGYSFAVSRRTTKGFTIVLNKQAEEDITLSWVAIAVKDLGKVRGVRSSQEPSVSPTSTTSSSLPPQATPSATP